jgi:hypothetical protein
LEAKRRKWHGFRQKIKESGMKLRNYQRVTWILEESKKMGMDLGETSR